MPGNDTFVPGMQATICDGLFEGSSTLTGDFATVAYRLQLLGFNALRIPFSFQVLLACSLLRLLSQANMQHVQAMHSLHYFLRYSQPACWCLTH